MRVFGATCGKCLSLGFLCATSVSSASLWLSKLMANIHHRDAENTEVAQRNPKLRRHRFAPLFALMIQLVESLLQFITFGRQQRLVGVRGYVNRRCDVDAGACKRFGDLE